MIKRSFFVLFVLCAALCSRMVAQDVPPDIIDFYHTADSIARFPKPEDSLRIMASKLIDAKYVTFLGYKNEHRVRITAVTTEPLKSVKDLSLIVRFRGAKPYTGKVTTWGYVFDRNGDGKIDYLALLGGAAAFLDNDVPADFPNAGQQLNPEQLEIFAGHVNLIFNHWADDDFNGKLDAVVQADMDPVKGWVTRRIFARSVRFNGKLDEAWSFRGDISSKHSVVKISADRIPYHPVGEAAGFIDSKMFAEHTVVLDLINRAAKLCGFKAADFSLEDSDD